MEWASVVAGVIAGIGSGFLSAVATPFVQRRTEETRARSSARRDLISQGRRLVADARQLDWAPPNVYMDVRYNSLKRHLPEAVKEIYAVDLQTVYLTRGRWQHDRLADAIDALERQWRLV